MRACILLDGLHTCRAVLGGEYPKVVPQLDRYAQGAAGWKFMMALQTDGQELAGTGSNSQLRALT